MALPCIITYRGVDYTYDEFAALLHEGKIEEANNIDEGFRLRHEDIDLLKKGKGLPDREKRTQLSYEELNSLADEKIKNGVDYDSIIDEALSGNVDVDSVDRTVLVKHAEDLNAKLNSVSGKEFDEVLDELDRTLDAVSVINSRFGGNLSSIRAISFDDESLGSFMTNLKRLAPDQKLTEVQVDNAKKIQIEYEEKLKAEQDKIKELESVVEKLKAENALKDRAKKALTKSMKIEDIRAERKSLLDEFKKEWNGVDSNEIRMGAPISDKMVKITFQLADTYIREGYVHLEDFVSKIYDDLKDIKDAPSKQDIQDIFAGKYEKKSKAKSDIQIKLQELKSEAALIDELDRLQKGELPKAPEQKKKRNDRIEQLKKSIKDFKKENGLNDESKLKAIKARNEKIQREIENQIANKQFDVKKSIPVLQDPSVKKRFPQLYKEVLDAQIATDEVRFKKAKAIYEMEQANRNWYQKYVIDVGKGVLDTAKSIKAGIDDSVIGIQAGLTVMANPGLAAKAIIEHGKSALSESDFQREIKEFHNAEDWHIIENSGLRVLDPTTHRREMHEEAFGGTNYLDSLKLRDEEGKVKINLSPTRPFERAFTSFGNNLAISLFRQRAKELELQRKTFESHPQEYKDLAKTINTMIGRADLPKVIDRTKRLYAAVIWSPRLIASSLNTLGLSDLGYALAGKKGYYSSLSGEGGLKSQRAWALKQTVKGIAVGVGIMAAVKIAGGDVDADPRSVTFGTVKFNSDGNSYNVFGRYAPYVRHLTMQVLGQKVIDNKVIKLGENRSGATKGSEFLKFLRGKVTPAAGTLIDWHTGEHYDKSEFNWGKAALGMVTPMSVEELATGLKQQGALSLLTRFPWSFIGIKVSNEQDFEKKGTARKRKKITLD